MKGQIIEKDLIEASGYTRSALRAMRLGQKVKGYEYEPTLEHVKHWYKMGPAVVYTEAGRLEVMRRAAERNNEKGES